MSTALEYDRVGAHGETVPGCAGKTGLDVYRAWVESTWPFTFLGHCAIRQTSSGNWSVHAVKRALDEGYAQNDRASAEAYLNYLTENNGARARILGVQALHDYAIGSDGSYGANRPLKRLWGHGRAEWRFGSIGAGWFWTHTELTVAAATSADGMRARLALLAQYDRPTPPPEPPPPPAPPPITKDCDVIPFTDPHPRNYDSRGGTKPRANTTVTVPPHPRLPATAKAVVVNIAMVDADGPGWITAWAGGPRPEASVQQTFTKGQMITGFTVVQLDAQRRFQLYTSVGCHLLVDTVAYLS